MRNRTLALALIGPSVTSHAQTPQVAEDLPLITATLMDYIDGTANGDPDQVRRAFHPDFNLYTVNDADSLWIRSGAKYIDGIKVGEKNLFHRDLMGKTREIRPTCVLDFYVHESK